MAVDDAGRDEHAGAVDDLSAAGSFYVGADFRDLAVLDQDRTVLDSALRDCEDGGVLNEDDRLRIGRSRGGCEPSCCQEGSKRESDAEDR